MSRIILPCRLLLPVIAAIALAVPAATARAEVDPLLPVEASLARLSLLNRLSTGSEGVVRELAGEAAARPGDPEPLVWLGIVHIKLGQPRRAIRVLRTAEKAGESSGLHKALGVAYYMERQYELFRQQMEKALAAEPPDPAPLYYLGRHFDSDELDFEKALTYLRRFLSQRPDFARGQYQAGFCLERLGKPMEARVHYRTAAELPSESQPFPEPWLGLARLDLAEGKLKQSLEHAGKAQSANPEHGDVHKLLGRLHEAAGERARAVAAWTKAAQLDPVDPTPHYRLFHLHRAGGDQERARRHLAEYTRLRKIYGTE